MPGRRTGCSARASCARARFDAALRWQPFILMHQCLTRRLALRDFYALRPERLVLHMHSLSKNVPAHDSWMRLRRLTQTSQLTTMCG